LGVRATLFPLLALPLLAACGGPGSIGVRVGEAAGRSYNPVQPLAAVAADEPRAVEAAARMLASGGSAMDAAAAGGFVLAVALPDRAGLAGGGMCLVHDANAKTVRTLDFLPRPGPQGAAVPMTAVGLSGLHGAGGRLRWAQVLAPAEALARGDEPLSRAAAEGIARASRSLGRDPEFVRTFTSAGRPPVEGTRLPQPNLEALLMQVRTQLAGGQVVAARVAQATDGPAPARIAADWRDTVRLAAGDDELHLADVRLDPAAEARLRTAAAMPQADRARALADALRAALPGDSSSWATIATLDGSENAVACALTLGAPAGAGRMAPGTGLVLAVPAGAPPAIAVVMNAKLNDTLFAGAAPGGGEGVGVTRVECAVNPATSAKTCRPVAGTPDGFAAKPGEDVRR